jgi:hypothetical protein
MALPHDSSSRNGSSSGRQNGEAEAEIVAMVIGARSGAATGPIPAEARPQDGPQTGEARSKPSTRNQMPAPIRLLASSGQRCQPGWISPPGGERRWESRLSSATSKPRP